MKICFTQSITEIEHIKKILGFIPVVVPLSLESLIYCEVKKIRYLDPANYINKDFYEEASLKCSDSLKKINFEKIDFDFIKNEITTLIRFKFNQIAFLIELIDNLKKKDKISEIFITNKYSSIEYDVMTVYPGHTFTNIENIFLELFKDNKINVLNITEDQNENDTSIPSSYKLIGTRNTKKKKILLNNSSYNFKRLIIYMLQNSLQVCFFGTGIPFYKKFLFKILGIEVIELKKIKEIKFEKEYDLKLNFDFKNINISNLIKQQLEKSTNYLFDLEKKYEAIEDYFNISQIQLVITNSNRDIGGILIENADKKKIKSLMISHGTISKGFNRIDEIYKKVIAEGVFSGKASYYAVQSKITQHSLDTHKLKGKPLLTGNLLFAEKNKFLKPKKTKCLYAVTNKPFSAMQFFGLEMYFEFFNNLKDLENFSKNNNYYFLVHLHAGAQNCLSLLRHRFKNLNFTFGKIDKSLKDTTVTLSYSSTVIEDSLHSKVPVILFDVKKRYKHCESEIDPKKSNKSIYYINNFKNLKECIETIQKSNQINFDDHIHLEESKINIKKLFNDLIILK